MSDKSSFELLIVKTGQCHQRSKDSYWQNNYGISPEVADYLRINFPNIRIMGFDIISVASFSERSIGKQAHRKFLKPEHPILLLEDMDLTALRKSSKIVDIFVAPMRIRNCDGLPCTVVASVIE